MSFIQEIARFFGIGNHSCRLCGWTSTSEDMFHDPDYGWFCSWQERCKYLKWQGRLRQK